MPIDVMEYLFVEILKWPGYVSYVTGNPIEDLVMLFFIPSALIIIFVWVVLNGLGILQDNKKMQLLFGIILFLFIVFSGYFGVFASLAKSYLIFIIFVYGILYFVFAHFRGRKGPEKSGKTYTFPAATVNQEAAIRRLPRNIQTILGVPELDLRERRALEKELELLNKRIEDLEKDIEKSSKADKALIQLDELRAQRDAIELKLRGSIR